jgi:hypothetical protein
MRCIKSSIPNIIFRLSFTLFYKTLVYCQSCCCRKKTFVTLKSYQLDEYLPLCYISVFWITPAGPPRSFIGPTIFFIIWLSRTLGWQFVNLSPLYFHCLKQNSRHCLTKFYSASFQLVFWQPSCIRKVSFGHLQQGQTKRKISVLFS